MRPTRILALLGLICLSTMAAECITVNDDVAVAVDIRGLTGTYEVPAGATALPTPSCVTKSAADYIDQDLAEIVGARLVDIKVRTIGTSPGDVTNGTITINGTQILGYAGSWNAFNNQQSLLTSQLLTRQSAGVSELVNAIMSESPITVCATGGLSQAATAVLSIEVEVFAQADAEVD